MISGSVALTLASKSGSTLPVTVSPSYLGNSGSTAGGSCPSGATIDEELEKLKIIFRINLSFDRVNVAVHRGLGSALYNYSIERCPIGSVAFSLSTGGLCLVREPVSVPVSVQGTKYSSMCGRIRGYGFGCGFRYNDTIDDPYLTGVSLTHD